MSENSREDTPFRQVAAPRGATSTGLELEGTLNALVDLSRQVIDSSACGIFQIAEGRARPELRTTRHASPGFEARVHQLHERGQVQKAFADGRPLVISEAEAPGGDPGQTCVIAPIVARERPLGVFVVACGRSAYTAAELDLVVTLAEQAAIALENVRLYQNLYETHQKLKASQAQLVQSGKMAAVGQLAAGVAHEVNNPLQIILSRVQLLMMRHREEERLVKDLDLIESNVKRISRIIRSLLDFARHNSGQEAWRSIDLLHLVTQTTNLMQHLMEKADIEVNISTDEAESPQIYGNVGEVEQVFLNLLLNAQQAMPGGGRIDIELTSEGQMTLARVRDTGEGIPKENLSRIFDPFFTTREDEGGTGLGLSIIYGIVEKHHGEIGVESRPGEGTTFTLRFPRGPLEGDRAG